MATRKPKKIVEEAGGVPLETKPVKKTIKTKTDQISEVVEVENVEPVEKRAGINRGAMLFGGAILLIGIVLLLGELFQISFGRYLWPLFIIIPGVIVFLSSLSMGKGGDAIAIVGGILTSVGAVLFFQNLTGFWASWAYAWSLIAPTSVGISQVIYGVVKKSNTHVKNGWEITKIGLIIFAIGFAFFELIIGLNGFGLGAYGLPIIPIGLIALGVIIMITAIFKKK